MPGSKNQNSNVETYWDYFFKDHFNEALACAEKERFAAESEEDRNQAAELKARVLLKQGLFKKAYAEIEHIERYSSLKTFLYYLVHGDLTEVIDIFTDDLDSQIYKAQCVILDRIYCGKADAMASKLDDPDLLLEKAFEELVASEDYDRAILSYAQAIELMYREQELAKDLIMPVVYEQLENLIALTGRAKYDSTKAKIYLLKAKLFKDREALEDAQILFGKDNNQNGLAEVYIFLATDFKETEYFDKALVLFNNVANQCGLAYVYESLASTSLAQGDFQDACDYFDKAEPYVLEAGIFEELGLRMQQLSLHAVKGEFKILTEKTSKFILENQDTPKMFKAQAHQILSTSLLYTQNDLVKAKEHIMLACGFYEELKKFNQLLNAKNIYFQILSVFGELEEIKALGEEIIQLANRLGSPEDKASKYVDLAFAIVRLSAKDNQLTKDVLDQASDYFKKAIDIHHATGNLSGEADVYQSMGNMFANLAKFEESYKCLSKARDLYKSEKSFLQASVTSTLIGLLIGDAAILNDGTYQIAADNFQEALNYFKDQNLTDLVWKSQYYLADLNDRFNATKNEDRFFDRAKQYYLDMLESATVFESSAQNNEISIGSTTLTEAFQKAEAFFTKNEDPANAIKFKRADSDLDEAQFDNEESDDEE